MQDRRAFIRTLMGLTAGAVLGPSWSTKAKADQLATDTHAASKPVTEDRFGKRLPQRRLGRTNEWVTMLGLGGAHIISEGQSEAKTQQLIESSIENGIRFIDTAQQYGRGESERRIGRFLTPKYRDVCYIMTKTQATDAAGARRDMDECRKRLNVDVLDLMQLHHIESPEAVDQRLNNGVLDVLLDAREKGQVRHLGFTGHDSPKAHLRMLERLKQQGIELDTVQMPINVFDPSYNSFIEQVLPKLVERDYGVLAMKTLAYGQLVGQGRGWRQHNRNPTPVVPEKMSLSEAFGYVWSLPVSTLISGMVRPEQVDMNAKEATAFEPLDEENRERLISIAAEFGGPLTEFYKASG